MDRKRLGRLLGGVAIGCVGLGVGWGLGKLGMAPPASGERLSTAEKLARVALGGFSIRLALAVHEAGHLLGALSQGFRFVFLAAGPVWIERAGEGVAVPAPASARPRSATASSSRRYGTAPPRAEPRAGSGEATTTGTPSR
jgi:hypothetical protein